MTNLRTQIESDLSFSLEDENIWGLPVVLIGPDGEKQEFSENSPDPENPLILTGQVLYETLVLNPSTGEEIIVSKPVVSLRRSSLIRMPDVDENWIVKIPETPDPDADLIDYVIDKGRPLEGGKSIGFIRLYLKAVEQI